MTHLKALAGTLQQQGKVAIAQVRAAVRPDHRAAAGIAAVGLATLAVALVSRRIPRG